MPTDRVRLVKHEMHGLRCGLARDNALKIVGPVVCPPYTEYALGAFAEGEKLEHCVTVERTPLGREFFGSAHKVTRGTGVVVVTKKDRLAVERSNRRYEVTNIVLRLVGGHKRQPINMRVAEVDARNGREIAHASELAAPQHRM